MNIRQRFVTCISTVIVLGVIGFTSQLMAQTIEPTLYNVYRISTQSIVDVDNDLMVATLVVQEEDKDAASLANKVNQTMTWALDSLKSFETIAVRSRDYQTYPVYENNKNRRLIGWRAQQSIELETDDFASAGKAIQSLQERLQVQNINLSVKPATREKASDVLIANALNAFKERAKLVQQNMGSGGFRILEVDIRTQQNSPQYYDNRAMSADSYSSRSVESAPAIASGSSSVQVQVQGRIQLD